MKQRGRGLAAIEYPTGMNQGGDPSQAWIKMKPDGRVDVFAGTVDIGQGSKTVHTQIVADTLGVPYDWVTMDVSNTDSSPLCTGTFASRGTFIGGNAVAVAAKKTKTKLLEIAGQLMEIDPSDLEVVEGEVVAKGVPDKKMPIPDVAGGATWVVGDMITGSGAWMKPYSVPDPDTGECEPHAAISYAACVAEVEVDDETGEVHRAAPGAGLRRRPRDQPDARRGADRGRRHDGPRPRRCSSPSYPYYPSNEHRGGDFGTYLAPALADLPEIESMIVENPSADGPFGAKAIGEMANNAQAPAICAAIYDASASGSPSSRRRPSACCGRWRPRRRTGSRAARASASSSTRPSRWPPSLPAPSTSWTPMPADTQSSPFRSWNGVERYRVRARHHIKAIGGEQVCVCHVVYYGRQAGAAARRTSTPSRSWSSSTASAR